MYQAGSNFRPVLEDHCEFKPDNWTFEIRQAAWFKAHTYGFASLWFVLCCITIVSLFTVPHENTAVLRTVQFRAYYLLVTCAIARCCYLLIDPFDINRGALSGYVNRFLYVCIGPMLISSFAFIAAGVYRQAHIRLKCCSVMMHMVFLHAATLFFTTFLSFFESASCFYPASGLIIGIVLWDGSFIVWHCLATCTFMQAARAVHDKSTRSRKSVAHYAQRPLPAIHITNEHNVTVKVSLNNRANSLFAPTTNDNGCIDRRKINTDSQRDRNRRTSDLKALRLHHSNSAPVMHNCETSPNAVIRYEKQPLVHHSHKQIACGNGARFVFPPTAMSVGLHQSSIDNSPTDRTTTTMDSPPPSPKQTAFPFQVSPFSVSDSDNKGTTPATISAAPFPNKRFKYLNSAVFYLSIGCICGSAGLLCFIAEKAVLSVGWDRVFSNPKQWIIAMTMIRSFELGFAACVLTAGGLLSRT